MNNHTNTSTAHFTTSDKSPAGSTIKSPNRWLFSTRFLRCPWLAENEYGLQAKIALVAYQQAQEALSAARQAAYNAFHQQAPKLWQEEIERFEKEHPYHAAQYRKSQDYGWFCLLTAYKAEGEGSATQAQLELIAAVKAAHTPEKEATANLKIAEQKDEALAESYLANDGPEYLVVVKNEFNHNYADDPDCFDGNRWMTVAPPAEWTFNQEGAR